MKKKALSPSDQKKPSNANAVLDETDFRQIQDLVKLITKNNICEISFEKGDYKLTIKQKNDDVSCVQSIPYHNSQIQQAKPATGSTALSEGVPQTYVKDSGELKEPKVDNTSNNNVTIKSPMIGTFYLKPAPDKPVFVEEGAMVKKGQVLCLIEAMKLFNEIESDTDGRIVKVLVTDSSPVEYDQALFLIEPK